MNYLHRLALVTALVTSLADAKAAVFAPNRLSEVDAVIRRAINEEQIVGGIFWLERNGEVYRKSYGRRAVEPHPEPMALDTIFDVASLTKVMATTPAVMLLAERGQIDLAEPVSSYIPEFTGNGRDEVTLRHLLAHTSGLRAGLTSRDWSGYERAIQLTVAEKPLHQPGTMFLYSDLNFILLGEIVRRVSQESLDHFTRREIFEPLGMRDTGFLPPRSSLARIAPTERDEEEGMLLGRVHDPTSRRMGGVAGHAGLFTTAHDLARFARMMLNGGSLGRVSVLRPETVRFMSTVQTAPAVVYRRGLGWDIDSPYSRPRGKMFPYGSFGHTGWTGPFLWIDPFSRSFYFFLSNRVHPGGTGNVIELQKILGSLAGEAIGAFDFARVRTPVGPRALMSALNGIDRLVAQNFEPLRGLKVGLITNHTGRGRDGTSTIDLLYAAPLELKALFSPEHGIRGDRDEKVGDEVDQKTGLPIYSLYGETRKPKLEQLAGLDALVFDIQDIGARFYTYISTMGLAMEAAAAAGIRFFVLDRINPITGQYVEGPLLEGETSFTAHHPMVIRHGMTVGELALMFREERGLKVDLNVIPVQNWWRGQWQDETWLPWVNPSPNMRSLAAATLYPGVCLLERTEVSVGRGTDTPFELVGAPYIDEAALARALESALLPGIRFEPARFTPSSSVFQGQLCKGVRMRITNRESLNAVDVGIVMAQLLYRMYPQHFTLDKVNDLLRHPPTIEAIRSGSSLFEIKKLWADGLAGFRKRREKYLLY